MTDIQIPDDLEPLLTTALKRGYAIVLVPDGEDIRMGFIEAEPVAAAIKAESENEAEWGQAMVHLKEVKINPGWISGSIHSLHVAAGHAFSDGGFLDLEDVAGSESFTPDSQDAGASVTTDD